MSDTSALRAEKCTSSLTTAWVSYAYHFEPVPTLNFISHFYFVFSLQRINKLDIIMIILNYLILRSVNNYFESRYLFLCFT